MNRILLCFLLFLGGSAGAYAQATCNPSTYQSSLRASNVMYFSRFTDPSIIPVSAHRGFWEYAIEGSPESIDAAVNICSEMAEMDLRLTSDNVPVPGHDWGMERISTGQGYIYDMTFADYRTLFLRDRTGASTTTPVPILADYLNKMIQYPNMVLVLDCKESVFAKQGNQPSTSYPTSFAVLKQAWSYIKTFEFQNDLLLTDRIIFKVRFNDLPEDPTEALNEMGINVPGGSETTSNTHLAIVPILYGTDKTGSSMKNFSQVYSNYSNLAGGTYFNRGFVWFPEAAIAFPGDVLQDELAQGKSVGNVTAFNHSSGKPEGSTLGSGLCCRTRNTGEEPANPLALTGDLEYEIAQGFHWLSTDRLPDLLNYLTAIGKRNTQKFTAAEGTHQMP